jgi:hypothetical protein
VNKSAAKSEASSPPVPARISSIEFFASFKSLGISNFNKLKSNVYNLGLSSANLTKYMLANKIKQKLKYLKIIIVKNRKDPDQRDYYVSNKKIEKKGFKAKINYL